MEKYINSCKTSKIQHTFLHTCNRNKIIYEVSYTPVIIFNVSFSLENNDLEVSITSKFLHQEVSYTLEKYAKKIISDLTAKNTFPITPNEITAALVKFVTKNPLLAIREEIIQINKKHKDAKNYKIEIKLKQKSCKLEMEVTVENYQIIFEIYIPSHYPDVAPEYTKFQSNIHGGVENSLKQYSNILFQNASTVPENASNKQIENFQAKPCIAEVVNWVVFNFKYIVTAECKLCNKRAYSNSIVRTECGCVFHGPCISKLMKIPPFNRKVKSCPNCKNKELVSDSWCEIKQDTSAADKRKKEKARVMQEAADFLS